MKRLSFLIILTVLLLAACAGSPAVSGKQTQTATPDRAARSGIQIKVKATHDTFDLIQVPFENSGYGWTYLTYVRPHYPAGVARDIYEKIWNCYVKTIERGDYDYDAYNKRNDGDPNWVTPIGEFRDDPSFHFHGVCFQYADYFEMLMKKEPTLKPLIDSGVLRAETAPSHKYWVYQEPNGVKYFIDPTWGDWTIFGTPRGQFAGWLEMSRKIEQSAARHLLVESVMRSWFFIQANAIGADRDQASLRNWDRSAHNLEARW
ncbi:MAG: hypothetical protein LBQ69_01110 [Treponema sp.]|jgi:hypothetical protein|nr:hypothetical protein [Treponema sp.]